MPRRHPRIALATLAICLAALCTSLQAQGHLEEFETDLGGWVFQSVDSSTGNVTRLTTGGNPDGHLQLTGNGVALATKNATAPELIQDLTNFASVTFRFDLRVETLLSGALEFNWPLSLELRDYDDVPAGSPYASIIYSFPAINQTQNAAWSSLSATIDDTSVGTPPPGWTGFGDLTDPSNPTLPPGRTFSSVLAGFDEVHIATIAPGIGALPQGTFDLRVDNFELEVSSPPDASCATFDTGASGWIWQTPFGNTGGSAVIEAGNGNPGANLRTQHTGTSIQILNNSDPSFAFNWKSVPALLFRVDVRVDALDVPPRDLYLELRNFDDPLPGQDFTAVHVPLASLPLPPDSWASWNVEISNTRAFDLPAGWGGSGGEGPLDMLPTGVGFSDVLAGIDEVVLTTEPSAPFGGGFPVTTFDVRLDNICIEYPSIFADGFESGDTSLW